MSALKEWNDFASKCYPNGMSAEQSKQLRRAFFAGALVAVLGFEKAVNTTNQAGELAAILELEKLAEEVKSECAAQVVACRARN